MPLIEARFCRACGVLCGPEAVSEDDAGLCPSCLHQGSEPEEGDYITTDHEHFYQHGKLALVVEEGDDWAAPSRPRWNGSVSGPTSGFSATTATRTGST